MKPPALQRVMLGDICKLRGGSAFKPALQGRSVGDFPFIKVSDFNIAAGNEIVIQGANNWVDQTGRKSIQGKPFPAGATVFAKIGEALKHNRKRYLSRETFIDNNLMAAIPQADIVQPKFLFHLLRTIDIAASDVGTAVPYVKASTLEKIEVDIPPLETQRRIAAILGAYDDLIEVNRRRVTVLEEMARGLFEEWFVRFRFPDHEQVPFLDTPNGPLPQGWSFSALEEVSSFINRGIAPKYDDTSATLVINQKCIRDGRLSLALARRQSKAPPPAKLVQVGDVLINSTGVGTLGRVAQVEAAPEGLTVDSHVTIVRPTSMDDRDYLGLLLINLQPTFEQLGAGSTGQTELSRQAVGSIVVVWPNLELRSSFSRLIRPMRSLVPCLMTQNERLAASRNLLLPRLISGQLSIKAAERELENAA